MNILKSKIAKAGLGLIATAGLLLGAASVSAADYTFSTNLTLGSTGDAVQHLQMVLNGDSDTMLSVAPGANGSSGHETKLFGPATKAAVMKFQTKYGITPVAGYVGAITRAKLNSLGGGTTSIPGCTGTTGFSTTTGQSCAGNTTTTSMVPGCTGTTGFSPLTGQSCAGNTTTTQTGPVMATLAMNNPSAGTVVTTQAGADLAHFTFTGSGTVTAVTLQRLGISADASLSNVYLYNGETRITDAASVTTGGMINFSNGAGLFTVNGSTTISVRADLAATTGESIGVKMTSFTTSAGTTTVAISGNLMNVATATNLATATFSNGSSAYPAANTTLNPAKDVTIWGNYALSVSGHDVKLTHLTLHEVGSINYADINNFRLFIDGAQIGGAVAAIDANGYVTFDTSASPVVLTTGSRTFSVMADVMGGSSRTFQFNLRQTPDIGLMDSQYNVGIAISGTKPTAGQQTVTSGSVTIQKATDSASGNITLNMSDASIGKFTFTVYGEPVKLDSLYVQAAGTVADGAVTALRNGRVLINGNQFGSTQNISKTASTTLFNVNTTLPVGVNTVEVRADIHGVGGDLAANDTIIATLNAGATNNAQGTVSGTLSTTTAATANTLTVKAGSMTIAKTTNYTNQTTVLPQTNYKVGSFQITGSSSEVINLNTVKVSFDYVTGTTFTAADLTNVKLVYTPNGGSPMTETSVKSTVSAPASHGSPLGENTWNVSHSIAINGGAQIDVYADIGSTVTATHSIQTSLEVDGTTAQSSQSVYTTSAGTSSTSSGSVYAGQTITDGAGSIASAVDSTTPLKANLPDNSSSTNIAAFKWTAANDNYTLMDVTVGLANTTTVGTVYLKDGNTVIATMPAASSVAFTGINGGMGVTVPSTGTAKVLTVAINIGAVGVNAGTSGEAVTATLTSYRSLSSTGTSATTSVSQAGNAMYSYAAVPLVTMTSSGETVGNGLKALAKFTVAANGGTIGWNKMTFTTGKTAAPILTSPALYDASNTVIPSTIVITGGSSGAGTCNGSDTSCTFVVLPNVEQQVSSSAAYTLKATVASAVVGTDSISTNVANPTTSHTAPTYGFGSVTGGGYYYNNGSSTVLVDAGDVRQSSVDSYGAALSGTSLSQAVTLSKYLEDVADVATTFTYASSGSAWTATGWTVTDDCSSGNGTATGFCAINNTDGRKIVETNSSASDTNTTVVTVTRTDGGYAVGSTVASGNTDLGLTTTTDVAKTASFLWSDLSAQSHTTVTADWNDDYLVKSLPLDSYTLQ